MEIPFNLNDDIKVKLTDKGYQYWVEYCNRYFHFRPDVDVESVKNLKTKEDKDGYVKFHLWEFMSIFGNVTCMGMPQYYDLNVILIKEE